MARQHPSGPGGAGGGLLSTAFVLLIVGGFVVVFLGLVAWSWGGFDCGVAVVLLGGIMLDVLGFVGLQQTFMGYRRWWILGVAAGVFCLQWIALALLT